MPRSEPRGDGRRGAWGTVTRLGATSILTSAAEYALYVALVELAGAHYVASSVSAGVFGVLLNFALNKGWVFCQATGSTRGQLARHVLVTAVGIGAGAAILYLFVEVLAIPYWIAWAMQNLAVFSFWTYPANCHVVFPAARRSQQALGPAASHNVLDPGTALARSEAETVAAVSPSPRPCQRPATFRFGMPRAVVLRLARGAPATLEGAAHEGECGDGRDNRSRRPDVGRATAITSPANSRASIESRSAGSSGHGATGQVPIENSRSRQHARN